MTTRGAPSAATSDLRARGVVLTVMGLLLLLRAGLVPRPAAAGGLADSLWTLTIPDGSWLLGAAAAGLVCFGIFQILLWRFARLTPLSR